MFGEVMELAVMFVGLSSGYLALSCICSSRLKRLRLSNPRGYRYGVMGLNVLWLVMVVQIFSPFIIMSFVEDIGVAFSIYLMGSTLLSGTICGIAAFLFTKAIGAPEHHREFEENGTNPTSVEPITTNVVNK